MAVSSNLDTGDLHTGDLHTGDGFAGETRPAAAEYFDWQPDSAPFPVHMHRDAIDGIARDVIEGIGIAGIKAPPGSGLEVGGLLLGRVIAGAVWIERYKRIESNHRLGPHYVLDEEDRIVLESTANSILEAGEFSVVGLYRSHIREGFDIDDADRELIRRYFADPNDLVLLIRSGNGLDMEGRFFSRPGLQGMLSSGEDAGKVEPVGEAFPFRGRGVSLDALSGSAPDPEQTRQLPEEPETRATHAAPPAPRRIVPDFIPSIVEPARPQAEDHTAAAYSGFRIQRWWPLIAAAAVVAAGAAFLIIPGRRSPAPAPTAVNEPARPLGLYVNPMGGTWHVSWNPNATALRDARSVQLFVREGDDQNRIELTPRDLASGTYEYRPSTGDVTFRLEVTKNTGAITAESFRYDRSPSAASAAPVAPAPDKTASTESRSAPRAIHRVPPVVPSSIRPRIPGTVPIDVKVKVDRKGNVVSAEPVSRQHDGLHRYLAGRAVLAARQWRFEPARDNGEPVQGEETIHFVFQR